MKTLPSLTHVLCVAASVGLLGLAACVEDDGVGTEPERDIAFLGYSDPDTRQTTCGNCHISKQRSWQRTGHAAAWADLQASGQAQSSCNPCHTTNGSSNLAPDSAGFFSVSADGQRFYYDVQCESCHGPGAQHVTAPDESQPLSTIKAAVGLETGCGTCHTGTHNPFVEEWQESGHGAALAYPAGLAACAGCHEGRTVLARFDPDSRFLEQNQSTLYGITCAVCHDPHGSRNNAELRYPIDTPDIETNLCMLCHHKRANPDPTTFRGAHSPQGPMLLGTAGWRPSTFTYDTSLIVSSHGSALNPRLCAGCHVDAFTVNDAATGRFVFHSTGHRFRAIPCVDAQGVPTTSDDCAVSSRTFRACATSGCHATQAVARGAFQVLDTRLINYLDVLWKDNNGNRVRDAGDTGLLMQVPAAEFTVNATITVAEGALFNTTMISTTLAASNDGSHGVHNPFYAEALLLASISEMRTRYGLTVPPALAGQVAARRAALRMDP